MKCEACDAELNEGDAFCHRCGKRVPGGAPEGKPSEDERRGGEPRAVQSLQAAAQARQSRDDAEDDDDHEKDLWEGSYSAKAMVGSWIGGAILAGAVGVVAFFPWGPVTGIAALLIAAVVIFGGLGCVLLYRRWSVHYELTTQRFVHRTGILKRHTDRIEVIDIDDVAFEQGLVQRMLGVGTIRISSSDRSHPELVLIGIDDVRNVADLVDEVRRKERRRRGLHIEAI